ncbi:hypothetical protein ACTXMK_05305 [Psychrobacter celer]|uniref:hypothetical protein n=1 Tax=Psychrobacter celer TaxID=306572 RepID=UPI003FCEFFAE
MSDIWQGCYEHLRKSHEWVYNEYHKTNNPVTKRSYLDVLKRRANNGSKKAAEFVRKIELSKNPAI